MNSHTLSDSRHGGPAASANPAQREIQPVRDALPAGTRLDEYELLSVLAAGRSSIVYLATDHGLQRRVAIKEYFPALLATRHQGIEVSPRSDAQAETFALGLEAFIDDARLLAHLDHPALVRTCRCWQANRSAYLAMPHYEGTTLLDARQGMLRPPDERWLHGLLLPLLEALDVLHDAGGLPRDISPQNILLQPDGRPVLLDLGAARHLIGLRSRMLTDFVDPAFAPVEQYAESKNLRQGPWSSLYALAAVAYYCVTGREPPASSVRALDDEMEPLFEAVDRLGRSFPELDYSVAFVSTIERCLSVRPQERLQSVAEFRRALLGGRRPAEDSAATYDAERHGTSTPLPPGWHDSGAFEFTPTPPRGAHTEEASAQPIPPWPAAAEARAEPRPPIASAWDTGPEFTPPPAQPPHAGDDDAHEAARWEALEAALAREMKERDSAPQAAGEAYPYEVRETPRAGDQAKAGGWRRIAFIGGTALLLTVLATAGWVLWSDYRNTATVLQSGMPGTATARVPARPLPPASPPTRPPEPQPGIAAEPPKPVPPESANPPSPETPVALSPEPPEPPEPPATSPAEPPVTSLSGSPVAASPAAQMTSAPESPTTSASDSPTTPPELPTTPPAAPPTILPGPTAEPPAAEPAGTAAVSQSSPSEAAPPDAAPTEAPPPAAAPAVADEAPSPPPRPAVVKKEPDNPRDLCAPRTLFALYRCMKTECERSKYFDHPECKYLRATDEVRPRK